MLIFDNTLQKNSKFYPNSCEGLNLITVGELNLSTVGDLTYLKLLTKALQTCRIFREVYFHVQEGYRNGFRLKILLTISMRKGLKSHHRSRSSLWLNNTILVGVCLNILLELKLQPKTILCNDSTEKEHSKWTLHILTVFVTWLMCSGRTIGPRRFGDIMGFLK